MPSKFKPTRTRKHRVLARQAQTQAQSLDALTEPKPELDPNVSFLPSGASSNSAKKAELRASLLAQRAQPKISAAKQKRLDKYIETKLRKDENAELIRKLGEERSKADLSGLSSSGQLGQDSSRSRGKKRAFGEYVSGQIGSGIETDHEANVDGEHDVKQAQRAETVMKPVSSGAHGSVKVVREVVRNNPRQRRREELSDADSLDSFEEENQDTFVDGSSSEEEDQETVEGQSTVAGDARVTDKSLIRSANGLARPLRIGEDGMPVIPSRNIKASRNETGRGSGSDESSEESSGDDSDMDSGGINTDMESNVEDDDGWEGFDNDETQSEMRETSAQIPETLSAVDLEWQKKEDEFVKRKIDNKTLDALLAMLGDDDDDIDERSHDESLDDGPEDKEVRDDSSTDEKQSSGSDLSDNEQAQRDTESDEESSSNTSLASKDDRIKPRASIFKSWAIQQLNTSLGHTPTYDQSAQQDETAERLVYEKPAAGYRVALPLIPTPASIQSAHAVHVSRSEDIQLARQALPVVSKEQEIMEAINNNPVVVIKGETGSGKTTQVPQFLFEAGYGDQNGPNPGMIGVTQPRRVAAVSMAKRVSEELGDHGSVVAHQIRFDTTVSGKTAIKFMSDGILLRELSQDLLLKKYSAIVIDEAHERSVNTDVLIGMLSKIVPARLKRSEQNPEPKPLKLIIMSATLNIQDFLHNKLFSPSMRPPVVEAEGRQHKVTTHFALRSRADYLEEVVEKVKRAHRKLPKGGILVFLTGQNEIKHVISQLRSELTNSTASQTNAPRMHISAADMPMESDDLDVGNYSKIVSADQDDDIDILVDENEADKEFDIDEDEDNEHTNIRINGQTRRVPANSTRNPYDSVQLLPLYSQLPTSEQLKVFQPPPDRSRMIILATNVAETSITIPGIRYIFDCGRSKEKKYDTTTGVQSFEIDYISKASAAQRAGRAGRTGPGHCWRLYSSAVYERYFPQHTEPEIIRTPADSVVLMLKGFRYPRPVAEFPFPTTPDTQSLLRAEILLRNLGALEGAHGHVTPLGQQLSLYPLSPRLAKILVGGLHNRDVLAEIILLVSALSVEDIFVPELQVLQNVEDEDERDDLKQKYGRAHATFSKHDKTSDVLKSVVASQLYLEHSDKDAACHKYFLRPKSMNEIAQLVSQLRSIVQATHPEISAKEIPYKTKLNTIQLKLINTLAASGFVDQIAIRHDLSTTPIVLPRQPTRAIDVPYIPLQPLGASSRDLLSRAVFVHPSSLLSRQSTRSLPAYVVYRHLQTSQAQTLTTTNSNGEMGLTQTKTRMFPLTSLDENSLLSLVQDTGMIQYGKPIPKTKVEDLPGTRPRERICWVSTEIRGMNVNGVVGTSWPLPPSRVRQVMDVKSSSGWKVVEVLG